jgi:hypothetical protein
MEGSGELRWRRQARAGREIEAVALAALREKMDEVRDSAALRAQAEKVASGEVDPLRRRRRPGGRRHRLSPAPVVSADQPRCGMSW